ncbi:transposase [Actinobacillus seminis]|uniref:transposase n=1 Tax=Actinobacillus seminis TaxID=722 RepID=UPI0013032F83|nr:transposase [Actinobacillus seminis]
MSNKAVCVNCPAGQPCSQSQSGQKLITRHIYQASVDRANEVRLSEKGKVIYARGKETVERSSAQNIKKIALVIRAILYCFMAWIREYIEVYRRILGMSVLKLVGQEY